MKKMKRFLLAAVTVAASATLAACGANQSQQSSTKIYNLSYSADPDTLDYLATASGDTQGYAANFIDGLMEMDPYGNVVNSLAKDWTVSKDGLTYTYHLRKGVYWYTSEGEQYAPVTAQDFVTGIKHAADSGSDGLYLIQNSIVGLDDYVNGNADFSAVGVKALDKDTVQYTLTKPESYWNSKLTNMILFPVNAEFLAAQGSRFGTTTDPSTLLYNGPYILSSFTSKSSIKMMKNVNYWDKKNVHIEEVNFTYNDGSDSESFFSGFEQGIYSSAAVSSTASYYKAAVANYKQYFNTNPQNSASWFASFNIDRKTYNSTSKKTDAERAATKAAILNKDFRQAIMFAFDRTAAAGNYIGVNAANSVLRSMIVPSGFVTIDGEDFSSAVSKELTSTYGSQWDKVNLEDAQESLYNKDKAVAALKRAQQALKAQGISGTIHLDVNVSSTSETNMAYVKSFKQSVESVLGKNNVTIDIHEQSESDYKDFYITQGSEADYDLTFVTGWTADYIDPYSYLQTLVTNDSTAYTTKYLGVDPNSDDPAIATVGLDTYSNLVDDANAITSDVKERYQAFAKAQAFLTDSALIIPTYSGGGGEIITHSVPYSAGLALIGYKGGGSSFKYRRLQETLITHKEFLKRQKDWRAQKVKSNAEYQEELASHVVD